jgi:pilus assembly protein CpaF
MRATHTPSIAPGDTPDLQHALRFQRIKTDIHRQMVERLDISRLEKLKPDRLRQEVRNVTRQLVHSSGALLSEVDRERLVKEIEIETFEPTGPLEPLMHDPSISDILVNGPHEVWIERFGQLERTNIIFADTAHLMQIIHRIAARVGRRADEMSPMVDARLPDGSRVHAMIPPASADGPVLSIRRFGRRLTAEDLLANSTVPPEMLTLLRSAVEARVGTAVSGGTGSGKTTLLNVLSKFIPSDERVITIEETLELRLQQPHVIRLETRPPNMEGTGAITPRELVKNALRMRPDRIVVGECRGAEALDMLQAMNTGHEGSMTTVHANDTLEALNRLEMMVLLAGHDLPLPVVRFYIASAVSIVIQVARLKGGARKVVRISEVRGVNPEPYDIREIFGFRQLGVRDGAAFGEFYATGYVPKMLGKLRACGIELPPEMFAERVLKCQPLR